MSTPTSDFPVQIQARRRGFFRASVYRADTTIKSRRFLTFRRALVWAVKATIA